MYPLKVDFTVFTDLTKHDLLNIGRYFLHSRAQL